MYQLITYVQEEWRNNQVYVLTFVAISTIRSDHVFSSVNRRFQLWKKGKERLLKCSPRKQRTVRFNTTADLSDQ